MDTAVRTNEPGDGTATAPTTAPPLSSRGYAGRQAREPLLRHDHDRRMWREVYTENEYRLPDDCRGWVVLDLGANVGAFSRLAVERGARVTAYEPAPDNFEVLCDNLAHAAGRGAGFAAHRAAVGAAEGEGRLWRGADPSGYTLYGPACDGERLTVPTVSMMGAVVRCLSDWGGKEVDLLKIDAEGAEYPIIDGYDFGPVRRLAVEFHGGYGAGAVQAEVCRERLKRLGFRELEWRTCHPEFGWFRLYRGER